MGFYEYCLNSSLHGLHFIVDRRFHWSERIFWTICVLASWYACLKLNILSAYNHSSNAISFTVDTTYNQFVTPFPSVIYCLTERNFSEEQKERLFPGDARSMVSTIQSFAFFQGNVQSTVNCERYPEKCSWKNLSYYAKELMLPCEDIFTSCYYNNEKIDCCAHFLPVNTYFGKCYAFNNLLTDPDNRELNMRFNFTYGVNAGMGNLSVETKEKYLFIVALSQDDIPSPLNTKNALLTKEGSTFGLDEYKHNTVYLSVKQIVSEDDLKNLEIVSRSCRFGKENNLKRYHYYSKTACDTEFMIERQIEECGCAAHVLLNNETDIECDIKGLKCISDHINILRQHMRFSPCVSNCRGSLVSFVGLTTKEISRKQFRNPTSTVRSDYIVAAPTTRYYRRVMKTPLDNLVAVGGAVALCVGASFLSIVEIIYYLLIRPTGDEYGSTKYKEIMDAIRGKGRQ